MPADDVGKPVLRGRGMLAIDEFCAIAGLDEVSVAAVVESGQLTGLVDDAGHAKGFFEDELPPAEQLRAVGLTPSQTYDPLAVPRTYRERAEPDDPDGPGAITW